LTTTGEIESGGQSPRTAITTQDNDYFSISGNVDKEGAVSQVSGVSTPLVVMAPGNLPTPAQSRVGSYEQMMGQGHVLMTPSTPPNGRVDDGQDDDLEIFVGQQNELGEKEMFSRLEKPRVRYDVEVVTKLVVYTGIGWLAVEVNPIIFELLGLGMGSHRPF